MDELNQFQEGTDGLLEATPVEAQPAEAEQEPAQKAPDQVTQMLQGAQDYIGGLLGQDVDERQQAREQGQAQQQQIQEQMDQQTGLVAETTRAVAGGVTGAVEGAGEFGELVGDTIKTFANVAEEKDDVFSDKYERADWDLGITENRTAVGRFAREAVSLLVGMRGAGSIIKTGTAASAGIGARIGGEALRGAVADLIVGGDDENLSNLLGELAPGLQGTFLTALAVDEDANPWEARINNVVEGAVLGVAVDGVSELIGAVRRGRQAVKAGKSVDDAVDEALVAASEGKARPGADVREADEIAKGSSPNKPATYEPNDGASRSTAYEPQDAARSQADLEAFDGVGNLSASPLLTDAAYDKILGPRGFQQATAEATESLRQVITETGSRIDVDALSRDLGQSWEETTAKALVVVRNFIGDNADVSKVLADKDILRAFDAVSFVDDAGRRIANREAVVAVKTLIRDTAMQIDEIGSAAVDVALRGADPVRQADMLFDRLSALLRFHKTSSVHYGSGLNSFKIGGLTVGNSQAALTKQLADMDDAIEKMRRLVQQGDPESMNEFKHLATGLALSGGDPSKQVGFWQLFRRVGGRDAMTTMYNSMLSSPLSFARNAIGNSLAVVLRPISMSIGRGLNGDFSGAAAALGSFHSFHESVGESLSVFASAFKSGVPANDGAKFTTYTKEAAQELDLLRASATTNAEKGAAFYLTKVHDLLNNPWTTLPTRALTAADDGFKTLTARMELKRLSFEESVANGSGLKFDKDKYAQLLEQRIGVNGEIVDRNLLSVAKENTFQQDLQGFMKGVDSLSKQSPLAKYFMPFIKTPHNLLVYTGTHTPLVNRFLMQEYKEVMKGSDETAKAIMRGREAIGWITATSAVGMALNDQITGNGPVDPQKRKIWLKSHQPNSIRVGDRWVSYASIEPLNVIFSAAADLTELASVGAFDAYNKSFGQLAYTLAQATYNRSYFQGLGAALAFANPEELVKGDLLARTGLDAINAFIPFSGARRQLAKAVAPGLYEWRNSFDRALQTAVPGYVRINGVEKIDIFTGESIQRDTGNPINNVLPFSITAKKDDPVVKALSDLGFDLTTDYTSKEMKGIEITAEQRQKINKLVADSGLYKELKSLFGKKWFQEDVARWEAAYERGEVGDISDARWYQAVHTEFSRRFSNARKQLARTDEEFKVLYDEAKRRQFMEGRGVYGGNKAGSPVQALIDFAK